MNETTTTLTTYVISKVTLRSSWQKRLPEVLYYKILVARVFANFLKSVYASIWDFSRTGHCMSTKFSHSHFKRSKLQFINIWKKTIQPYKSYGSRNFFRKLSISQELLIRSSKKMHMHNFRYTTITWPSFKEIHRVVSEEKRGQILIHIYIYISYIYKETWNFFNEVVMIYNLWNVEKIHFPLFLPQLWRV